MIDVAATRADWAWHESGGEYRLMSSRSPIRDCEAHLHDTYIIAFVRRGSAVTHINSNPIVLTAGSTLLVNPYEIIECISEPDFEYDVCYPDQPFMQAVMLLATGLCHTPRFVDHSLDVELGAGLGKLLGASRTSEPSVQSSAIETDIFHFLASHPELFSVSDREETRPEWVIHACQLIESLIEDRVPIAALSSLVSRSRSHFARVFRDYMGLSPNSYFRQLRLARALQRVREGEPLAELAVHYGFFDQAHFTREFKRVYGTTPGALARDVTRCRHCC